MTLPSGVVTFLERATADIVFPAVTKRLTKVARIAFEGEGFRDEYPQLDRGALRPNVSFKAVLSRMKEYQDGGDRTRPYLSDLYTMMATVENSNWSQQALDTQLRRLESQRIEILADVQQLHLAVREYVRLREQLPAVEQEQIRVRTEVLEFESARSVRERSQQARVQVNNKWVEVLFDHPRRYSLFAKIAESEAAANIALEGAFLDAHRGISKFRQTLKEHPHHIWRYPPLVVGTLADMRVLEEGGDIFRRFMLDIARLRSKDAWERLYSVAGINIGVLAIFAGPIAGITLTAADIALSGHAGWREFERQRENDYAQAAQAFANGQPFSDRPSNYGPVALEGAAVLLSAFELPKLIREARAAENVTRRTAQAGTGRLLNAETIDSTVVETGNKATETDESLEQLSSQRSTTDRSVTPEEVGAEARSLARDVPVVEQRGNRSQEMAGSQDSSRQNVSPSVSETGNLPDDVLSGDARSLGTQLYDQLERAGWHPSGGASAIWPDQNRYPSVEIRPNGDILGSYGDLKRYLNAAELSGQRRVVKTPTIEIQKTTFEAHHLVEDRLAELFKISEKEGRAIALEAHEHAWFSAELPRLLSKETFFDIDIVYEAHAEMYRDAGRAEWITEIRHFLRTRKDHLINLYERGAVPGASAPDFNMRKQRVLSFLWNL